MSRVRDMANGMTDMLFPIVWRQVRREMSSRWYVFLLLLLHLALVTVSFAALTVSQTADTGLEPMLAFGGGFLFALLPLLALGSLKEEQVGGRSDLLLMAGLGPRSLVYGHWIAHCAKIIPVVASALPYIFTVLLLSSRDLGDMLRIWMASLGGSCTLIALGVGISAIGNNVVKGLVIVGGLVATGFLGDVFDIFGYKSITALPVIMLVAPVVLVALELSSLPFRLPAERQMLFLTAIILYSVLLIGAAMIFDFLDGWSTETIYLAFGACAVPLCMEPVYRRGWARGCRRLGSVGKVLGFAAGGGWPSGILLTLLALAMDQVVTYVMAHFFSIPGTFFPIYSTSVVFTGVLLAPLAVALNVKKAWPLTRRYIVAQIGMGVFGVMFLIFISASALNYNLRAYAMEFCSLFPHLGLLAELTRAVDRGGIGYLWFSTFPVLLTFGFLWRPLLLRWRNWMTAWEAAAAPRHEPTDEPAALEA